MIGVGTVGPAGQPMPARPAGDAGTAPDRLVVAALAVADGIGPRRLTELLGHHRSPEPLVAAARELHRRGGRASARAQRHSPAGDAVAGAASATDPLAAEPDLALRVLEAVAQVERLADVVGALDLAIVTLDDAAYPERLRRIDLPPPVLFIRGSVEALAAQGVVAVVGTRRPSEGGRRAAARIAGALARVEATVVSGLALGIDGAAHRACLDESGRTVAVLGSGHAVLTPRVHRHLADTMVGSGGAVVSEFAPWREAASWSFPRRNRLISGLADATVVVEAGAGSGALITAGWALEQGRECFIVPGTIDAPTAAGGLRFLREHHGLARIVADLPTLLEDLGLGGDRAPLPIPGLPELGPTAVRVMERLALADATVDEIAASLELPTAGVLAVLARLELAGLAVQGLGRYRPSGLLATRPPAGAGAGGPGAVGPG
jgi:DNA processing protein